MKKFVGFVLICVVIFGFIVPQIFLSASYAMDRALQIDAPRADVRATITDLHTWKDWSAWNIESDDTLTYEYMGTRGMVGHRMVWDSESDGRGWLEITNIQPDRIDYKMEMQNWDPSTGAFLLADNDGGTAVTWEMTGEISGMAARRYYGVFMLGGIIGPKFEDGLRGLKDRHEAGVAAAAAAGE